jgi:hypothetical protein
MSDKDEESISVSMKRGLLSQNTGIFDDRVWKLEATYPRMIMIVIMTMY